jgi:hypothetical protein
METASLSTLSVLAKIVGAELGFELDHTRGYVSEEVVPFAAIMQAARALVSHWGASTIETVEAELSAPDKTPVPSEVVTEVLETLPGFEWLDERHNWFWMPTSRNRLLNQIQKIMSVAGSISISELRDGAGRFHRMNGFRPPKEVLANLCVSSGKYRRDRDRIIIEDGFPSWEDVLGGNERTLVDVLFTHGPVMRREDLEKIACDERGINRSSFYIYLTYSPFMARYAQGVFGLRGANISPAQVRALVPPRVRRHRLRDHGWTADRKLWLGYEVSAAGATSGVLHIDATIRELVDGTYELRTEDGRPVGRLVARGGAVWGLSPFFRRWGVEEGDYVLITLDATAGIASITAGSHELLLARQGDD